MEKRGLKSPDIADALALTFADAVPPATQMRGAHRQKRRTTINELED